MRDVSVLYFAWVRERIGRDRDQLRDVSPQATVGDLVARLSTLSPAHAASLAESDKLRFALDQRFVKMTDTVKEARELAIFPPVTGG